MTRNMSSVRAGLAIFISAATLAVAIGALAAHASAITRPTKATEAKAVSLVETAQLKFAHEDGAALVEHGYAAGTYNAPVTAILTIHPTYVTAVVTIFPRGGSITGSARANYIVKNSTGYYGGDFAITRGTGSFRHVSGKALGISGTINRYTFDMTVKAHGRVTL